MPTVGGPGGRLVDDDDDDVEREPLVEMKDLGGHGAAGKGVGATRNLSSPSTTAAVALGIGGLLADPAYASVVSCFAYTFCSITMVLANKALASGYHADIDFLVIAFQVSL